MVQSPQMLMSLTFSCTWKWEGLLYTVHRIIYIIQVYIGENLTSLLPTSLLFRLWTDLNSYNYKIHVGLHWDVETNSSFQLWNDSELIENFWDYARWRNRAHHKKSKLFFVLSHLISQFDHIHGPSVPLLINMFFCGDDSSHLYV